MSSSARSHQSSKSKTVQNQLSKKHVSSGGMSNNDSCNAIQGIPSNQDHTIANACNSVQMLSGGTSSYDVHDQLAAVQDKNLNNDSRKQNGIIFMANDSNIEVDPIKGMISKAHATATLVAAPENKTAANSSEEVFSTNSDCMHLPRGQDHRQSQNTLVSSVSDNTLQQKRYNVGDERSSSWIDLRSHNYNESGYDGSDLSCTEQLLKSIFEQFDHPLEGSPDTRTPSGAGFMQVTKPQTDPKKDTKSAKNEIGSHTEVDLNGDQSLKTSHGDSPSKILLESMEGAPRYVPDGLPQHGHGYWSANVNGHNFDRAHFMNIGDIQEGPGDRGVVYPIVLDPYTGHAVPAWRQGYANYPMMYPTYYPNVYVPQPQIHEFDREGYYIQQPQQQFNRVDLEFEGDGEKYAQNTMDEERLSDGDCSSNDAQPIERKLSSISDYDEKPIINFNHSIQQESERFSASSSEEDCWDGGQYDNWETYFAMYDPYGHNDIELDYMYGGGAEDFDSITESSIDPGSLEQSFDEDDEDQQHLDEDGERPSSEECYSEKDLTVEYPTDCPTGEDRDVHLLRRYQREIDCGNVRLVRSRRHGTAIKLSDLNMEQLLYDGTFSTVFKASNGETPVAVSVYPGQAAAIDGQSLMSLKSSLISKVLHCAKSGPDLWLLHTYLYLGDLASLLEFDLDRHVFGEVHAQFVVAGLFLAVDYLHRHGIVHGNIQPSKVLINDIGYPVLSGFRDMVEPVTGHKKGELTGNEEEKQNESRSYSLWYASPERLQGLQYDNKADSFSIGCLAYEIITGWTPFEGESDQLTIENILDPDYRPEYNVDLVSFGGEKFIEHCLQRNTESRFETGRLMTNLLREEWLSSLNLRRIRKQLEDSPLFEAFRLLATGEGLVWEEKSLHNDWGRVMDVLCPHRPSLPLWEES